MKPICDPRTGVVIGPDEFAQKLVNVSDELETKGALLATRARQLAVVTARWQDTYDEARGKSTAKAADQRDTDARTACRLTAMPDDHMNLTERKIRLESEVRVLRDDLHNLRAILSAYQSAARAVGSVYTAGVGA